ncbi:FBXL16 (predicted) [Pycnogonum litorale]
MSADVGCTTNRSAANKATSELSRCFASLGLSGKKSNSSSSSSNNNNTSSNKQSGVASENSSSSPMVQPRQMGSIIRDKIRSFTRQAQAAQQPQTSTETTKGLLNGIKKKSLVTSYNFHISTRFKPKRPLTLAELWNDDDFLRLFFSHFQSRDLCVLAQVCTKWRDVLYDNNCRLWSGVVPVLNCRELRAGQNNELSKRFYRSLDRRAFDSICLMKANDEDIYDFISNYPPAIKNIQHVILRCSNITDKGLEAMLDQMQCIYRLEIAGCNEITEAGLWAALNPKIISLSVSDCINVADESMAAIAQLLPSLCEFNLQAYHVTDQALGYFTTKQGTTMSILRLRSCWELTNHGLVNLVNTLPNLTILSLAGCNKITDDGIELIAENLRKLTSLDISWCPRITDAALEYIACDLNQLDELTLDRCVHVTDIGIGYLSTMTTLTTIMMRWCPQIRDFGLQHLCSMRNLKVLSLAGCAQLTSSGLSSLIQLKNLRELELTNCPGALPELLEYLCDHLPKCLLVQ